MMRRSFALAALATALLVSTAHAQNASPAVAVSVTTGAGLESEADRYGRSEFDGLKRDLAGAVAARAARGGFTRLDLRLEYARPNHPTSAQLGRQPDLSPLSLAIGGATVTGMAYRGDGAALPLKFSWYETELRLETAVGIWDDADRAFELLGSALAHGEAPDHFAPGRLHPRPHVRLNDAF